jgi:hypothetical protein
VTWWRAAVLGAILLEGGCAKPVEERITAAEQRLILPAKARPVAAYDRYYRVEGDDVNGRWIFAFGKPGGFHLVKGPKLPMVYDGGCDVIHLHLDLRTGRWDKPFCNGSL